MTLETADLLDLQVLEIQEIQDLQVPLDHKVVRGRRVILVIADPQVQPDLLEMLVVRGRRVIRAIRGRRASRGR